MKMSIYIKLIFVGLALENTVGTDLHSRMDSLEEKLTLLTTKLIDTNARLKICTDVNEHQNKQLQHTQFQLSEAQTIIGQQKRELIQTKQQLKELAAKNKHEQDSFDGSFISFTASANQTRDYNEYDQVLFDSVLRNYGSAYHPENSTFVCPYNGYYMFGLTIRADGTNYMTGSIYLEDTYLVTAYAGTHNAEVAEDSTGSTMLVTFCQTGERVTVKCAWGEDMRMVDNYHRYTIFTGTLLRLA